jgi:uncharacterized integral membrane protein
MMNNYQYFVHKEISNKFYAFILVLFMIALLLIIVIMNNTRLNQYKNQVKILSDKLAGIESKHSLSQTTIFA